MEDKYVNRYSDYLVNWFNEDHSGLFDRTRIVNSINNGYSYELALDFVQENAEYIIDEIYADCLNSTAERAEILLIVKEHLTNKKSFRKVAMHPQVYVKIFYCSLLARLVETLNKYLTDEFEIEI